MPDESRIQKGTADGGVRRRRQRAGRPSRTACRRANSCIASDNIRSILEA